VRQQSTASPAKIDPAIADLADRLADALRKAGVKRVLILEMLGPSRETHPVGGWLADRLTEALRMSATDLQILARGTSEANQEGTAATENASQATGQGVGSDGETVTAVVAATFWKSGDRLRISLKPKVPSNADIKDLEAVVSVSPEITALSTAPLPQGVYRAAVNGTTAPGCVHCPLPEYSEKARSEKLQGSVTLDVLVTTEGAIVDPRVLRDPGMGLEEKALEQVKTWKLKPCTLKGTAVPCRVIIQVTFKLLK
jgi:TonB family protein